MERRHERHRMDSRTPERRSAIEPRHLSGVLTGLRPDAVSRRAGRKPPRALRRDQPMTVRTGAVLAILVTLFSSIESLAAWGGQGHRLVGLIAAERLTPAARQQA